MLLVVVHELGHAIVAKRNGVEVEEFGIGFPPRAWKRKLKNGTIFTLNWLPLGGFVRLRGEHDAAEGPGTYGGATMGVKAKILLAGVVMNWVTAVVIFTVLALAGIPELVPNQFSVPGDTKVFAQQVYAAAVANGSPAQKAGIAPQDVIVAADHQKKMTSAQQLVDFTSAYAGKQVTLTIVHDKQPSRDVTFTLNKTHSATQGYAGISPYEQITKTSTWSAPIMNVLPIPALDGGRLFVTLIFRGLKRPLTKEREESIQAAGFVALMLLVVLVTVVDVGRLTGK